MNLHPEKPYIGVTGITLNSQAQAIRETFITTGLASDKHSHRGMIGLLASQGTLLPEFPRKSRYPNLEQIRQIFEITKGAAFNTLHYHTYRKSTLSAQIEELLKNTGLYPDKLCEGLQLNTYWPPAIEVEEIKQKFPDLKIILQLGPKVLSEPLKGESDISPEAIVNFLTPYRKFIDYVLIDPSGGKGEGFQAKKVSPLANNIRKVFPDLALVFAGGFNARNVKVKLRSLFRNLGTTDFSIDAEEGLRTLNTDQQPLTQFNEKEANKYSRRAVLFFAK